MLHKELKINREIEMKTQTLIAILKRMLSLFIKVKFVVPVPKIVCSEGKCERYKNKNEL